MNLDHEYADDGSLRHVGAWICIVTGAGTCWLIAKAAEWIARLFA